MARGRMLNKSVCASMKFHKLPDDTCRLMATWIISQLDCRGVFYADPGMIRSLIFPRRSDIGIEQIQAYIWDMAEAGLIELFDANDERWQYWPGFTDNQIGLRADRESSGFPPPPCDDAGRMPAECRKDSGEVSAEVNGSEVNLSEGKGREFPDAQDLAEPPQQAATPPEPTARRQKAKPAKEPPPPAVKVYFAVMGKYPPKPLWPRIEADVGDKRELWSQVINGWLGMGWNGGNVNGMLDFLKRGEVPGTKGKNDATTRRHDTGAGWAKRDGLTQADLDRILAERAAEAGQ